MSDIRFSCPQCQQHIQAEQNYAGMEIACPVCNARMVVPGTPSAPAPVPVPVPVMASSGGAAPVPVPPAPVSRVSISRTPSAPAQAATGTRFQPGMATATARTQPAGPARTGVAGVLLNPLLYIALAVLTLSILFILGRSDPTMKFAFYVAFLAYWLTAKITVIVCGFRESATDGILTLLCDFYCIYFALKKSDSNVLKALYGSVALIALALRFMD